MTRRREALVVMVVIRCTSKLLRQLGKRYGVYGYYPVGAANLVRPSATLKSLRNDLAEDLPMDNVNYFRRSSLRPVWTAA